MSRAAQIKVAGYVRVSTAEQAHGGESLETQKAAIHAYAKKEGYKLTKIYEDAGISGAKLEYGTGVGQVYTVHKLPLLATAGEGPHTAQDYQFRRLSLSLPSSSACLRQE
jgi:hypothetical protein